MLFFCKRQVKEVGKSIVIAHQGEAGVVVQNVFRMLNNSAQNPDTTRNVLYAVLHIAEMARIDGTLTEYTEGQFINRLVFHGEPQYIIASDIQRSVSSGYAITGIQDLLISICVGKFQFAFYGAVTVIEHQFSVENAGIIHFL